MNQNNMEYLKDNVQQGKMTADQANIEKVRMNRLLLVIGSMPASIRKALTSAVKTGYLCHLKKEPYMPECYYHPDFKYLAIQARKEYMSRVLNTLKGVVS